MGTGQFSRSRSAPKPRGAADPSRHTTSPPAGRYSAVEARAGQAEQRGERVPGRLRPGELGRHAGVAFPAGAWPVLGSGVLVRGHGPQDQRRLVIAGCLLPGHSGDVPGQVPRDQVAATAAQEELAAEVREAALLIPLLDQCALRHGEVGEQQREPGQQGARLEEQVPHGLLLVRVQLADRGELGDEGPVGERDARGQLLRDGVVVQRPVRRVVPHRRRRARRGQAADEPRRRRVTGLAGPCQQAGEEVLAEGGDIGRREPELRLQGGLDPPPGHSLGLLLGLFVVVFFRGGQQFPAQPP